MTPTPGPSNGEPRPLKGPQQQPIWRAQKQSGPLGRNQILLSREVRSASREVRTRVSYFLWSILVGLKRCYYNSLTKKMRFGRILMVFVSGQDGSRFRRGLKRKSGRTLINQLEPPCQAQENSLPTKKETVKERAPVRIAMKLDSWSFHSRPLRNGVCPKNMRSRPNLPRVERMWVCVNDVSLLSPVSHCDIKLKLPAGRLLAASRAAWPHGGQKRGH